MRDLVEAEHGAELQRTKERLQAAAFALGKVEERLDRLTNALLDELVDPTTYAKKREALLLERAGLAEAPFQDGIPSKAEERLEKLELANTALLSLENATEAEIRDLAKSLSSNLKVCGKQLVPTPYFET